MSITNDTDSLPFNQLTDSDFQDLILHLNLDESKTNKLRNMIFNPFQSIDNRGKTYLTLNPELDPDSNYYDRLANYVDECEYHQDDSFNNLFDKLNGINFSTLYLNIRSITNKYDDFQAYLNSLHHNFSVIGLTETWLNKENNNNYPLPNYFYVGKIRENKTGGGVGLYVNEAYPFKERNDLNINIEDVMESQFIELKAKPTSVIVGVIYRPPNNKFAAFKDSLNELLEKLDSQKKKCILMGDFNFDLLKSEENPHVNDFLNQMFSSCFYPLITRPTRITNSSASLIDNIFVNNLEESFTSGILFTDLSDHLPVFQFTGSIQHKTNSSTTTSYKYRQINEKYMSHLCQNLERENWLDIFNIDNPEEAYNQFFNKLHDTYDKSIPLKKSKFGNLSRKIPWLTKGLLTSRKTKNKLYKKYLRKPNEINERKYKRYRNKFNKLKRAAKKLHYEHKFDEYKGNLKLTWKLINNQEVK